MEIDIDEDSLPKSDYTDFFGKDNKGDDKTEETDGKVIELEKDTVKVSVVKHSRKIKGAVPSKIAVIRKTNVSIVESTLKQGNVDEDNCGVCELKVYDEDEGICCDGNCKRWFHLPCSELTQMEYDELGLDEHAKWACTKCSGRPPTVLRADTTPPRPISVREKKAKPPPATKRSANKKKKVAPKTKKSEISNNAYIQPFDFVQKNVPKTSQTPSTVTKRSPMEKVTPITQTFDVVNKEYLKPFELGWRRELVYRSKKDISSGTHCDVYYFTPKGKKLRSVRDVTIHLIGSDLTVDNFTFKRKLLGISDPEKETIRNSCPNKANRALSATPTVPKQVTSTTKRSVKVTKKKASVTPMDNANSHVTSPVAATSTPTNTSSSKALASVTPRVVNKTSSSTGPKLKVTASNNSIPGKPPRATKRKNKKIVNRKPPKKQVINPYKSYEAVIADPRGSASSSENDSFLENAKTLQKSVNHPITVPLSGSDDDDDDDHGGTLENIKNKLSSIGLKTFHQNPKLKTMANCDCLCEHYNTNEIMNPLSKSTFNDNKTNNNRSRQCPSMNKQKSYGCQTSSSKPQAFVRPSSLYDRNFEKLLIVDTSPTSGNYISTAKHRESQYKSPLFCKDKDSSLEISSVQSLNSEDQMGKYDANYIAAIAPLNKSPCSLRQIKFPQPSVPGSSRGEPIPSLPCQNLLEHCQCSLNNAQEEIMDTKSKDSLYKEYRKLKQERLNMKRTKIERARIQKAWRKERAITTKLFIEHYQLKMKLMEFNMKKIKRK